MSVAVVCLVCTITHVRIFVRASESSIRTHARTHRNPLSSMCVRVHLDLEAYLFMRIKRNEEYIGYDVFRE